MALAGRVLGRDSWRRWSPLLRGPGGPGRRGPGAPGRRCRAAPGRCRRRRHRGRAAPAASCAAPAQLLEHLAHALQALAVAVAEPALHHAAQRGVEVAVVQQVVGDLLQDAVGVELEADLRAVPAGVGEPARHGWRVPPPAAAPSGRPLDRGSRPGGCKLCKHLGPRPVSWSRCGCRGPSSSWTSPGSRTTRPRTATMPPARVLAASGRSPGVASDRGVRMAKWLGDGCMIVAIDQDGMIAAALDLEREATAACAPLSVRVGMATGLRPAVRGRRLHRLGRQPRRPPV